MSRPESSACARATELGRGFLDAVARAARAWSAPSRRPQHRWVVYLSVQSRPAPPPAADPGDGGRAARARPAASGALVASGSSAASVTNTGRASGYIVPVEWPRSYEELCAQAERVCDTSGGFEALDATGERMWVYSDETFAALLPMHREVDRSKFEVYYVCLSPHASAGGRSSASASLKK